MSYRISFGDFQADLTSGELHRNGIRVKIATQPFQILAMLLERPQDVVSREEIRERLWGNNTFVDFDHGLNAAVNKLRQALRDSAAEPRYIETIPGRGYRFIARVSQTEAPVSQKAADLPEAPKRVVSTLLILIQCMYLGFYIGALSNLPEIGDVFEGAPDPVPGGVGIAIVAAAATIMIPVRLYLLSAIVFRYQRLADKFRKLFPALMAADLMWALSPFLLIHHINAGAALAMCAALVYVPFAQRSLIRMLVR